MPPSFTWWRRLRDALSRRAAAIGGGLFSMRLASRQHLQLRDAAGWTVVCRRGSLWITQEADVQDIFLTSGQGFLLDRPGLALVCAREDTVLVLRPPGLKGRVRVLEHEHPAAEPDPRGEDRDRLSWLRALYPENGPWNEPAAYRRAGLL